MSTSVFDEIQPLLLEAIPKLLTQLNYDDPICIVRVFYYDTHAPYAYLDFRCVSSSDRGELFPDDEEGDFEALWGSGEECGDQPSISIPEDCPDNARLTGCFSEIYGLIGNDESLMPDYRDCIRSITKQLNTIDWASVWNVTDDFVIAPADGSMHFADDAADVIHGVPETKVALLRERGFFSDDM